VSKANTIRKRALEHARRQDWDAAIRDYRQLAEIDRSNPNLHNELGDIYLKTGNKADAYDSFATAIDSYASVSLFNNAVAVCKKVARLIPTRYDVLAKLGCIRKKQGLAKEAESYCLQYLDQLGQDPNADPAAVAETAEEIAASMSDCAVVLERLAESLFNNGLDREAARILAAMFQLYQSEGLTEARDTVREQLKTMGLEQLIETEPEPEADAGKEGPVITEDNIWTDSLSEGERISVSDDAGGATSEAVPMSEAEGPSADAPQDYRTVDLPDLASPEPLEKVAVSGPAPPQEPIVPTSPTAAPESDPPTSPAADDPDVVQVSAIIGDGENAEADMEDYRSHYDLGMAYLEMNLFTEAVREYQLAARSPEFQTKSLEMVGLCFLKQNQPTLAIKQLNKGLSLIDDSDSEALGIKYNLGLAYEMVGDLEKAQAMFEDVYVVDVTFRDTAEKIAKYTKA
jgi:tetratricopeptide (TPR) repeat protein